MIPTAENLRQQLLPGVDSSAAVSLEDATREFISKRELPLYRMMSFQFGWVDENGDRSTIPTRPRVHGQFAISIANAISAGGTDCVATVIPYAISLELLHNFTLIHEDVEDGNTEHNGRPSVWWAWGPAQAINAGDGMHAMARMALFALTEAGEPSERVAGAVHALDRATVMLCEGEYIDITMQEQIGLTTQKYIDMVRSRSGALFGATAQIAALASGRPELVDALFEFGQLTGTARQLAADYVLFWGGEDLDPVQHGRLLTKKKNLPVAHAIETAPPTIKRKLGDIYVQRIIDPAKTGDITKLLEEAGSREFTLETIERLAGEAVTCLDATGLDAEAIERLTRTSMAVAGLGPISGAESGGPSGKPVGKAGKRGSA